MVSDANVLDISGMYGTVFVERRSNNVNENIKDIGYVHAQYFNNLAIKKYILDP